MGKLVWIRLKVQLSFEVGEQILIEEGMSKYRAFLFPESQIEGDWITLDGRESHHLIKVFRARRGETVEVLDGQGRRYLGRLCEANARAAVVQVEKVETVSAVNCRVTLLQAMPKGKAMDLILRMASEIGIAELQPVYTAQSEVTIPEERIAGKVEKWRATTVEACKQCGLAYLPDVLRPQRLRDWFSEHPRQPSEIRLVASLEEGSELLLDKLREARLPERVVLAVGPEGDFSAEEYAALRESGFAPVRLGRNVLRAETAVAYMLSVIDQRLQARGGD